jgi:hypothetical protein
MECQASEFSQGCMKREDLPSCPKNPPNAHLPWGLQAPQDSRKHEKVAKSQIVRFKFQNTLGFQVSAFARSSSTGS